MSNSTSGVARPSMGFARPMGISPMVGVYDGKDLRPCATRPTRPTRDVPTRVGSRLHYRDGRVTDLAGVMLMEPKPNPPPAAPAAAAAKAPRKPVSAPKHIAATAPPPPLRTVSTTVYKPRPGSLPARAIATLRAMPPASACLRPADTERLFGITRKNWKNYFTAAIAHGELQALQVDGDWALALPSYRPAAAPATTTP